MFHKSCFEELHDLQQPVLILEAQQANRPVDLRDHRYEALEGGFPVGACMLHAVVMRADRYTVVRKLNGFAARSAINQVRI